MEWKEYEEITKHIYETLGSANGVKIECHGNDCKVVGKSSVAHQIDVLTSHTDGLHSYKTAVECKYWDKTINKDIVMKVAEIVEDAAISKGVIVSKNGFTPDAISYATYKNIGLIELREPNEEDWQGRVKDICIKVQIRNPQIQRVEIMTNIKSDLESEIVQTELLDIVQPNGVIENVKKYLDDFFAELCKKEVNEEFAKIYEFDDGTLLKSKATEKTVAIKGIKIVGIMKVESLPDIEIKGGDHIFMIMKSIFEDKRWTITRDKQIAEMQ